jgi:uncharacterized membrane protein (DUF485 family)
MEIYLSSKINKILYKPINNKGGNMLHEPAVITGKDNAAAKKAKLGVILFIVYTIIYSGFVIIGLTNPELMGLELIGGQNIAIIYGFGLIILAIVMGFVYNFFCTRMENKMNKN